MFTSKASRRRSRRDVSIPILRGPFDGAEMHVPRGTTPGLSIVLSSGGVDAVYSIVTDPRGPGALAAVLSDTRSTAAARGLVSTST